MRRMTFIAIAAGLLFAGPAFAGDQDMTQDRLQTRDRLHDGTGDGTPDLVRAQDRLRLHDSATVVLTAEEEGSGTMARERARARTETRERAGEATATGSGAEVRERARFRGCESGDEACMARHEVRNALAEQAGMPEEPAGKGEGERVRATARHAEAERAAYRHAERYMVRERAGEAAAVRHGSGAMAGSGPNATERTQAAETNRNGEVRGPGAGGKP